MNFNELKISLRNLSASFCRQTVSNKEPNYRYVNRIKSLVNLINSENPKIFLQFINSINTGINNAFDRKYITITVYRNNDIKERTVIADTLRPGAGISELYKINKELLLKTEYLYIQKQLERQIYNFKHEPADLYNQRFNAITENNLKEITKSLKGRDIYSLNDKNKLQEISSLKALQELLYQCHIKELNSIVILKDKRDSRAPSVVIDDDVRFKMLHLIKPFEQKIKNDLGRGNR